jgi:hypothetical protein
VTTVPQDLGNASPGVQFSSACVGANCLKPIGLTNE